MDDYGFHLRSNVRILCLDDGGVRVLSSLGILDRLMILLKNCQVSCQEGCRPSLHFDLICGSGWGGLVAILLGRLGLTLAECKKWLLNIGPDLEPVKLDSSIFSWNTSLEENNRVLRAAMKSLIRTLDYEQEALFSSPSRSHCCKTMVLTMHPGNLRKPIRLRSYTSRSNPAATECTIWQAAVAIMAMPTRYVAEKFGDPPVPHISPGIGYGNPAKEGLDEAVRVWQLSAIDCIVSIGTGVRPSIRFDKEICHKGILATDYDRVHNDLIRDAKFLGLKYFRFSVIEGLVDIAMQEWRRVSDVFTATSSYAEEDDVSADLNMCASYLENSSTANYRLPSLQEGENLIGITPSPPNEPGDQISSDIAIDIQLFDAEVLSSSGGGNDAIQAADQWFRDLDDRTQVVVKERRRSNDKKVKVAILDTGINMNKFNYRSQIKMQKDFTNSNVGMSDEIGHGTKVAALLSRVAPKADLYIAKIVSKKNTNETPAIEYAVDTWDVDIISMSFGSRCESDEISDALDHAYQKKKILFAAASNEGSRNSRPSFPGRHRVVLCIHSAKGWGNPSNYNPPPAGNEDNFTVLGEAVANPLDDTDRLRGTSIATPIAAGIAALILELLCQGQSDHWRIQRPERLWTYAGMRNIFLAMSSEARNHANGYHFVQPWDFLNDSKGREHVMRDISYRMKSL